MVFHSFWWNLNKSIYRLDDPVNNIFQQELTIYHHQLAFIPHSEPIFLHSTSRLMHSFGEVLSPFGMNIFICSEWLWFHWLTWKIQDAETISKRPTKKGLDTSPFGDFSMLQGASLFRLFWNRKLWCYVYIYMYNIYIYNIHIYIIYIYIYSSPS